jgi:hypothetical protein
MKSVEISSDKPITAAPAPNDFVRVFMRDGRVIEVWLSAVEADALVSGEQRLPIVVNKLDAVSHDFAASDTPVRCAAVKSFISHVQTATTARLSASNASYLVPRTQAIESAVGCPLAITGMAVRRMSANTFERARRYRPRFSCG